MIKEIFCNFVVLISLLINTSNRSNDMGVTPFKYKKAVQLLNLLAEKEGGSINRLKALKLAWLADRSHLRKYGRTITGDVYYALPHGPIGTTLKNISENNQVVNSHQSNSYRETYIALTDKYSYKALKETDEDVFSDTDLDVIKNVYSRFGNLQHFELRDLSHLYPEWVKFESELESGDMKQFLMDIEDFFKEAPDCDFFSESNEIIAQSLGYFKEKSDTM